MQDEETKRRRHRAVVGGAGAGLSAHLDQGRNVLTALDTLIRSATHDDHAFLEEWHEVKRVDHSNFTGAALAAPAGAQIVAGDVKMLASGRPAESTANVPPAVKEMTLLKRLVTGKGREDAV